MWLYVSEVITVSGLRRVLQITARALVLGTLLAVPAAGQDRSLEAREASARGDMRTAITAMRAHVATHPEDTVAKKDLARYFVWTGNYAAADDLLSSMVPQDPEAVALLANSVAWAGKIDRALALNAAGLQTEPADFLANYTQAIALRQSAQAYRAWPFVEAAERIRPQSKDSTDLYRATQVTTASDVRVKWGLLDDSDGIQIQHYGLSAALRLSTDWRLLGGWDMADYSAPLASGFAPISGGTQIDDQQFWLGASYTPAPDSLITAHIGNSDTDAGSEITGLLRWNQRVNDDWRFSASLDRNRLGISPRSVSLGLMRNQLFGQVRYTPGYNWTIDGYASFQDIDDGNNRLELQLAARRAVLRYANLQLDLGGALQWLAFKADPGNGYYAPDNYRRAAFTAHAYFPLSDDVGLAVRAGVGIQRDENFSSWKSANDLNLELTAGIFSDWELRLQAAYATRTHQNGLYDAKAFSIQIKRRF